MESINLDINLGDVFQVLNKLNILILCFISICFINIKTADAGDIPNPSDVEALAIYSAMVYSSDIPDDEVNYNITDPIVIANLFQGIENKRRDCSKLESKYMAYLYVKYKSGAYEVFAISGGYYVYIQKLESDICYWIFPESRDILRNNIQE
jgi:hypothetical protein